MNKAEEQFLRVFRCALNDLPPDSVKDISDNEWPAVLRLADIHRVFPMIFEYCCALQESSHSENKVFQKRKLKAVKLTCDQAQMTAEFLALYRFLLRKGLAPVVMKGIICRNLYPEPERRSSSDEDLLIRPEQFHQYQEAFREYGLKPALENTDEEKAHEVAYCNSKVYIELHKSPFPPGSEVFGDLNHYFKDADAHKITEMIYSVPVRTMEYTEHLFYQICHAYKHFLNCGIGIRIASDITLYSITYYDRIDWERILEQCREVKAYEFIRALYKIGNVYLFPETFPQELSLTLNLNDVEEESILEDILQGGLYGTSSEDRLHSSNITLNAAATDKRGKEKNAVISALFPAFSSMKHRYPYL